MKKKIIIIIGVFAAAALLALPNILNAVREQKDAKKYDNAFNELFVTEKNAVAGLYTAIGNTIDSPDKEHYGNALNAAIHTEQICGQTVYYATFYRDIKAALTKQCGTDDLKHIYELLGKIMSLYNTTATPGSTYEKKKEIEKFFKSLSLLNNDMDLTDLTKH